MFTAEMSLLRSLRSACLTIRRGVLWSMGAQYGRRRARHGADAGSGGTRGQSGRDRVYADWIELWLFDIGGGLLLILILRRGKAFALFHRAAREGRGFGRFSLPPPIRASCAISQARQYCTASKSPSSPGFSSLPELSKMVTLTPMQKRKRKLSSTSRQMVVQTIGWRSTR